MQRPLLTLACLLIGISPFPSMLMAQTVNSSKLIDSTTLDQKVLCGYQGWFRCPGDGTGEGWRHWSRNGSTIRPDTLTFEMWPDLNEFSELEKYPAPGFTLPNAKPAALFSSAHPLTVRRHFEWMQTYGIDGVFLQRFLVSLPEPSLDLVLQHVRTEAARSGRIYAICYDLSGTPSDRIFEQLTSDWKKLVDEKKVTRDDRYLRHKGKPLVFVWGFYSDRFSPALAHQIIDFFQQEGRYSATLVGGCQWYWRTEKIQEWARAFRRLDVISPWNVGNHTRENGRKLASTGYWADDLAEAKRLGKDYLPVIYPGFAWTNLMGKKATSNTLPRLNGDFFWNQFVRVTTLGINKAYVAMFDEVDEGTAIFKVTNHPPTPGTFATFEGLPTDWYLRLTGEGTRLLRGERKPSSTIPIHP